MLELGAREGRGVEALLFLEDLGVVELPEEGVSTTTAVAVVCLPLEELLVFGAATFR